MAVMLYVWYPLSLRNVEDLLSERGVDICHETVRFWWNRFGPLFTAEIRRRRVNCMRGFRHWRWHLDEVFVKISGERHYLWRAVDHEGEILESYVTTKRDKSSALKFLKKTLTRHGLAEVIVTDGLGSYPAAMRKLGNLHRREMRRPRNGPMEEQPGRKFSPAIPTTRAGGAAISSHIDVTKIPLGSCRFAQPFQLGAPSRRS